MQEEQRILLCLCHMSGREMDFISEAMADNWVVPLGPNVTGFEKDIEKFLYPPQKKCVALSSGTAAIHLGLLCAGVEPGDEVIVQSFTFSASANPVVYLGATPVFVDSEPYTWNIDPDLLEEAIKARMAKTGKKPKAIVPVHLYGMPAKIEEIMEISRKWEIPVVEDAAEALGSTYKGQKCGTFGKYGALSFNGNKIITTSGGGMLVCENKERAREVLKYATQSREAVPWYQHEKLGFNYRMSNICAGIGRGQMYVLGDHIRHHREVQSLYKILLEDIEEVKLHENPSPEFDSNFWLSAITFSEKAKVCGETGSKVPEKMRQAFEKENIETRHLWKPMHLQPFFKDSPAFLNGVSESLFEKGLCLPAGPWVGEKEVKKIVKVIKENIGKIGQ